MTYDEFVTQARSKPTGYGPAGSNGIVDAYGTNYASPDRYDYYRQKEQEFINALYAAHPERMANETTYWGESQYPVSNGVYRPIEGEADPYQQFMAALTPSQRAEYAKNTESNYSKGSSTMKGAAMLALAATGGIGALANPGAFSAFASSLGGTGAGTGLAEGSMADLYLGAGGAPLTGAEYAGLGGLGAEAGGTAASALEAANAADMAGGLVPEFGSNAAYDAAMAAAQGTPGYGAAMEGVIKGLGDGSVLTDAAAAARAAAANPGNFELAKKATDLANALKNPTGTTAGSGSGSGGGTDWSSLLGGAGLGAAAIAAIQGMNNKTELPAIPDYLKLAEQTSADKTRATNEQTLANRPNQTNAMGDTSQWTKDPTTGAWTQKVSFGAPQQAKFDETNTMLSALRGQIGSSIGKPLDMSAFQTPASSGVDLSKLQPAGYTPQGSSQIMQDILRTKKVI